MDKYKTFDALFNAFITGKIAVKTSDGKVGLYSNCPDYAYWQIILKNLWDKANE